MTSHARNGSACSVNRLTSNVKRRSACVVGRAQARQHGAALGAQRRLPPAVLTAPLAHFTSVLCKLRTYELSRMCVVAHSA